MEEEKLNKNGLIRVWLKIWTLLKLLVGDVDVVGKGDLQTQIDNLDNKVDECFRSASDGKKLIADAVTGKGIPTLVSDTFATIAANIAKIKTSAKLQSKSAVLSNVAQTIKPDTDYDGLSQVSVPAVKGTAGAGDVLTGKTFSGAAGIEKAGTMPENGAWTGETTGNGNVPIPAGHHNGQGYVSGAGAYAKGMEAADARTNTNSANYKNGYSAGVTATKKGTAAAGDVLAGKTFTNASSVGANGTMLNNAAVTVDAGATTQDDTYTYLAVPSAAFYNANSKLRTKNSNILNFEQLKAVYNGTSGNGISVSTEISVPSNVKRGLIVVSGYAYFVGGGGKGSIPILSITGTGLKSSKLITDGGNLLETEIYACEFNPNGTITATSECSYGINAVQIALLYN